MLRSHLLREADELDNSSVLHAVVGESAFAARGDVPTVGETREVRRDAALGEPDVLDALRDRALSFEEELQQCQADRVAQPTEEPAYRLDTDVGVNSPRRAR